MFFFHFQAEICFSDYPFASEDRTKCCKYPIIVDDYSFNCTDYVTSETYLETAYFISIPTVTGIQ